MAAAAALFGLRIEGDPDALPEGRPRLGVLWPSNVAVWDIWLRVQSQWRVQLDPLGLRVYTGLDYAGVTSYLWAHGHRRPELGRLLDDLHACEVVASAVWENERVRKLRSRNGHR